MRDITCQRPDTHDKDNGEVLENRVYWYGEVLL